MHEVKIKDNDLEIYNYIANYAEIKYQNEIDRENSIIQHASHLQTAFSFITVALFMVAPILLEYRAGLSIVFFLIVFSSISIPLLFSLFAATMAQNRKWIKNIPDISDQKDYILLHKKDFITKIQRSEYAVDTYSIVQLHRANINNKRVKWIQCSSYSFYVALLLCVFWFVVGIIKTI